MSPRLHQFMAFLFIGSFQELPGARKSELQLSVSLILQPPLLKKCDDMYGDELSSTNHLFILKQIQRCEIKCPIKNDSEFNQKGSLFSFKACAVCVAKKLCVLRPPGFPKNSAQRHGRCDRSCRSRLPPACGQKRGPWRIFPFRIRGFSLPW